MSRVQRRSLRGCLGGVRPRGHCLFQGEVRTRRLLFAKLPLGGFRITHRRIFTGVTSIIRSHGTRTARMSPCFIPSAKGPLGSRCPIGPGSMSGS